MLELVLVEPELGAFAAVVVGAPTIVVAVDVCAPTSVVTVVVCAPTSVVTVGRVVKFGSGLSQGGTGEP